MAARCSKCNSPLDGDFGMITCVQCGEINFLDESPGEPTPATTQGVTNPSEGGISMPSMSTEAPGGGWSPPSAPVDNFPTPLDNLPSPVEAEPVLVEPKLISSSENPLLPTEPKTPPTPEQAIQEIADFGNQPLANTASGNLYYDVHISRIDTLELRKALIEVLKDGRFKWNIEEIERAIHDGSLTLRKLSPIKASVLIKKVRHLDVDVFWSQGNIYAL